MLNCGHHNYAGLIEFDLIIGGLVHDHDDIYEIEGVNELGATSAWNLILKFVSTVCCTGFCSEIE